MHVPALERRPNLDPDLAKLLDNFLLLSQGRIPAFEGIGTILTSDIIAVYEAEGWDEGGLTWYDYLRIMRDLDGALRGFKEERAPSKD